jgi:hypothetical protein
MGELQLGPQRDEELRHGWRCSTGHDGDQPVTGPSCPSDRGHRAAASQQLITMVHAASCVVPSFTRSMRGAS